MSESSGKRPYDNLPLGKEVDYPQCYDASLLCPIARQPSRDALGLDSRQLPFFGVDIWNAFELSWLDGKGKPVVAQAEFRVPADSPAIIESKSFKLYLNSLNQSRFNSVDELRELLVRDLSAVAGSLVEVLVSPPGGGHLDVPQGECLDTLDVEVTDYQLCPERLNVGAEVIDEQLYSHLLRSLCPVTGQPDWATVVVQYHGPCIDHKGLLQYIIGYREHQEFHEQCVERIYRDLQQYCRPEFLLVYARYLRRGGLDINPYRCSDARFFENTRLSRQ